MTVGKVCCSNFVTFNLFVQPLSGDPQQFSGPGPVATRFLQGFVDQVDFKGFDLIRQRKRQRSRRLLRGCSSDSLHQLFHGECTLFFNTPSNRLANVLPLTSITYLFFNPIADCFTYAPISYIDSISNASKSDFP